MILRFKQNHLPPELGKDSSRKESVKINVTSCYHSLIWTRRETLGKGNT